MSGFCLNWASSNTVVKVLGGLIGRGAILAICMVMLLLPVFLMLADAIIPHTYLTKRAIKRREPFNDER